LLGKKEMSGYRRQGIDSTAFDSLLTMSNSTVKLVLIKKKITILGSRIQMSYGRYFHERLNNPGRSLPIRMR
jgi:hypothetical protein